MNKENGMTEQEINELRWQEERQLRTILDENLSQAPVSYEWKVLVPEEIIMKITNVIISLIPGGLFVYAGLSRDSVGLTITGVIFSTLFIFITRYLFSPDKDMHYKLTPLGIIYTEKDTIPDVAYTIMRGFAWFSAVACLATVVYVGPLAFVGAGGMALLAVKFTGFKAVTQTHHINFIGSYKIKIIQNKGVLSLWTKSHGIHASGRFYFEAAKEDELIKELSKHMEIKEIIQVKSMRELDF